MSKPFLGKQSSIYYAKIKTWDAEKRLWTWRKRSLGTDDYDLALSMQASLQATATAAHKLEGKTVDRAHLDALITSIYASSGVIIQSDDWPVITSQMEKFMKARKARVKFSSYRSYRTYRNVFLAWIPDGVTLDWLTPVRAGEWYEDMLETTAPKTANERVRFVSRFYDRCMKDIGYPSNPCKSVDMTGSKNGDTLDRLPFTYKELLQLVKYLQKGDDRAQEWSRAVMVASMTGARLEDAITMQRGAIVKGVLTYTQTKTGKTLSIPLAVPAWRKVLEARQGAICPALAKDYVTSKCGNVSKEFTALVTDAGIVQLSKTFKSGRVVARKTFHSLRHTLRTLIVSSGGSDAQADLILGHSGDQGKSYTHSETDAMRLTLGRVFSEKSN